MKSSTMVSCLCCTYNRNEETKWLLEEAIHCFNQQTHKNSELLILNDTPDMSIQLSSFNTERIRIVNAHKRYAALSDKIAHGISVARGDVFMRWDDDDYSLPHRIEYSLDRLHRTPSRAHWSPRDYIWCDNYNKRQLRVRDAGNLHVASVWTRKALKQIGGYPLGLSGNEDQWFDKLLRDRLLWYGEIIPPTDVFYFYRWGVSPSHLSAHPQGVQTGYNVRGREPVVPGILAVSPQLHTPYSVFQHPERHVFEEKV